MTESPTNAAEEAVLPDEERADAPVVTPELMQQVQEAVEAEDADAAQECVLCLHEADQAEIFHQLNSQQSEKLAELLSDEFNFDVLPELESDVAEDVLHGLGIERSVEAIASLETEDAVQIIEDLSSEDQQGILDAIDTGTRRELEEGLAYPDSSAGRLMRKKMVCVPEFWTVGDTIDLLRSHPDLPGDFYVIFVVNPKFRPVGEILLAKIMQNSRDALVNDIMNTDLHAMQTDTDQEEVAYSFRKYGLVEAPVLNNEGRLVGTITVDDVVEVMQEELEEDFARAAGVHGQELHDTISQAVSKRFPWLFINLLTAIAASAIIDLYQETIAQLVLLAVLMPIIASMGGNAGIQAATVAVRAIATRRIAPGSGRAMMIKEMLLGAVNGLGLAVITALGIYIFYQDVTIAAVFATATIITMIIAGLSGVGLPLLLVRLGVDPAIASGVFLTMLTDMVGFFAFLGLAAFVIQ